MQLYPALVILSIISTIFCADEDSKTSIPANDHGMGYKLIHCTVGSYHRLAVRDAHYTACRRLAYRNSKFKWLIFKFFQYPKVYNPPPEERFTIPGSPYFIHPFDLNPSLKNHPNMKNFAVVNEICKFVGAVTQYKEKLLPKDDGRQKGCVGRICQYFQRYKFRYKKCSLEYFES
ncbi:hypothetical protein OnM2_029089 [Erysiphe neolycopersici]|uniref:Uncharacterized protein n=1 Tax=Erysiphe neolycopersici TaxID=212602 RepID=A0A420HZM8_9PEZI|nr:hypothetical protein OnM2_029089 [Erysiphe neolycopersici]